MQPSIKKRRVCRRHAHEHWLTVTVARICAEGLCAPDVSGAGAQPTKEAFELAKNV